MTELGVRESAASSAIDQRGGFRPGRGSLEGKSIGSGGKRDVLRRKGDGEADAVEDSGFGAEAAIRVDGWRIGFAHLS